MNHQYAAIREDPSSLYMHSRIGLALKDTLDAIIGNHPSSPEFAHLTTSQKLVIQKLMLASMKKENLVELAFEAQKKLIADPIEASMLETKLTSMEVKGKVHSYNAYKGTYTFELDQVQIVRNGFEMIARESENLQMSVIATEYIFKAKK
jgi:hypothetical protein